MCIHVAISANRKYKNFKHLCIDQLLILAVIQDVSASTFCHAGAHGNYNPASGTNHEHLSC